MRVGELGAMVVWMVVILVVSGVAARVFRWSASQMLLVGAPVMWAVVMLHGVWFDTPRYLSPSRLDAWFDPFGSYVRAKHGPWMYGLTGFVIAVAGLWLRWGKRNLGGGVIEQHDRAHVGYLVAVVMALLQHHIPAGTLDLLMHRLVVFSASESATIIAKDWLAVVVVSAVPTLIVIRLSRRAAKQLAAG